MATTEDIKNREKEICEDLGMPYVDLDNSEEEDMRWSMKQMERLEKDELDREQEAFYKLKPSTKQAKRLVYHKSKIYYKYKTWTPVAIDDDSDLPF